MQGNTCWGQFDAVLIVPVVGRRSTLIGFEAKLESDTSLHTKEYPYVNQIMRNLEAGYWLTHHEQSMYREWDFHYVFVCPKLDFDLMSTYYSWVLTHQSEAIDNYSKVLDLYRSRRRVSASYDGFKEWAMRHLHWTYWSTLAGVLTARAPDYFSAYIQRLAEPGVSPEIRAATEIRLCRAGIRLA